MIGGHLLKACEKVILDLEQQKRFILKFLYMFDQYVSSDASRKSGDKESITETLIALIETLGRLVSLEFLKHCSLGEIKILFYSIWNVAYEAKQYELYKECQIMLK